MERRPEPRDYENNPRGGPRDQSVLLGLICLLISLAGLVLVAWLSNG